MAYSYFETTVSALESAKRTVGGVDYYDLSYTTLDYTPLFSTTQLEADKYVSNVGDELQVTLGVNTLDRSSNTDLWIVDTTNSRVTINTGDTAWSTLNPQGSDLVRLSRISKKDAPYVDYANAAVLTEQDLDAQAKQSLHIVQESIDIANDGLTKDTDGKWNAGTRVIKNVGTPDNPTDVATKGYVDGTSTSATVAAISNEITTVAGVSTDVTTVAGAVKETIAYTVDVANSVFRIQGGEFSSVTEKPALNLQRGSTYTFNYTHSSILSGSHVLGFSSADTNTNNSSASPYTTGVTNDTTSKIITFVVPSSAPSTLYYYCTAHPAMGNTMNIAEDSIEVLADNIANVNLLGPKATEIGNLGTTANVTNMTNLNASGVIANIATLADSTYKTKVETVADSTYKTKVETVADSTYKGKVETVAGSDTAINNIYTNINSINNFGDTYHQAGSSAPTTSNVTTGDLWFDTGSNTMKVYNGSAWVSASSSISTVSSVSEFSASDGQGTGNKYFAKNHDQDLEIVWLNGVRLKQGHDYLSTATNTATTAVGSTAQANFIRLETVPSSTDTLSVMAFGQISNTNVVSPSGGTFSGSVTFEAGTTHNTGSNTFTMPTTRGSDGYVLTRDNSVDSSSGIGTTWKESITQPAITSVTTPASDNSINEDTNVTMTINGSNFSNSMSVSLIDATSGATVTGHNNLGIASFVSSAQITVNTVAATSNISNSNVKVKLDKSGLTAESASISVSPDPAFSAPSSNGTTLATILDVKAGDVDVVLSSGIVASASDSAAITYALDQTSTNANNTWQFNTTTGVVTSPTAGVYDVPSGTSYTEPFTVTATAGGDSTRTDSRTFNIIVNKTPTGGTISSITGYRIHTWNATGTTTSTYTDDFVVPVATRVEILMVGGGGSGGASTAGGGGAGGLIYVPFSSAYDLPAGTYTVVVGGGGTAAYVSSGTIPSSTKGSNSTLTKTGGYSLTALGGGTGGATETTLSWSAQALGGGSAGGQHGYWSTNRTAPTAYNDSSYTNALQPGTTNDGSANISGTTGYGNLSGLGNQDGGGAGGGGAGSAGGDGSSDEEATNNGLGGTGKQINITGTNTWYAAGGSRGAGANGAAGSTNSIGGAGGTGNNSGSNGADNTGSGGGGSWNHGGGIGGNGGSGIVIIRYAV